MENNEIELAQISVNALNGDGNFQSLRVTGHSGKIELQILMDTDSSHNFIDTILEKKN